MMVASFSSQPRVTVSTPRILFEGVYEVDPFNHDGHNYDVMPDGEHFIMIRSEEESSATEIHVVLNWFNELERLVPTK